MPYPARPAKESPASTRRPARPPRRAGSSVRTAGSSRDTRDRTSLVHEEIHRHAHAHFHGDTVETCGRELPLPDRRERRVRELGVGGRQNPQVLEKAVGPDAPFEEHRGFAAPPILRIPRLHISHLGRRPDASTDGDWLHGSTSGWLTDCRGGGGGGAGGASRPDGAGGGGGGGASLSEMLTLIVSWSDPSCTATSPRTCAPPPSLSLSSATSPGICASIRYSPAGRPTNSKRPALSLRVSRFSLL